MVGSVGFPETVKSGGESFGVGAGSYAVSGNIIYSLNKAGTAVYRYNGDPGSWTQIGGLAVSISRC
ncbi:MAG: hypothetical protein GXX79_17470 [Actinomycetales bacterium]|nr:hypothetical protein [Actinomycetales bacterium]